MTSPRTTESPETSLTQDIFHAARYYLGGRRGLLIFAGTALAAGLALNWSWLAAAGIAPILISVLPCAAMCALGLCMNRTTGKSCSTGTSAREPAVTATDAAPTIQTTTLEVLPDPPADQIGGAPLPDFIPTPEPQSLNQKSRTDDA